MSDFVYPCEACQGLTPLKRIRCEKCNKLYCKYHIKDHICTLSKKELALKRLRI